MSRPVLRQIDLKSVWPPRPGVGDLYLTMSVGQWDEEHRDAYDVGAVLIELDDNEQVLAAYQRETPV